MLLSRHFRRGALPGVRELPFASKRFSLLIDGHSHSFFQPADPNDILDRITGKEFERDEFQPYWTKHWPAAEAMVTALDKLSLPRKGMIAEIGCGLGVVSAAAAVITGLPIVSFDIAFNACRYTSVNMQNQNITPRVVTADVRHSCFSRRFDAILCADILYEERWVEPTLDFIDAFLCRGGSALCADPLRKPWTRFKDEAGKRGYSCTLEKTAPLHAGNTVVEIVRLIKTA